MSVLTTWISEQSVSHFIKNTYLPLQKSVGGETQSPRAKAMSVGRKALNNLKKLASRVEAGAVVEINELLQAISLVELAFSHIVEKKQAKTHRSLISKQDADKLHRFVSMLRAELKAPMDMALSQSTVVALSQEQEIYYANQSAYHVVDETLDASHSATAEIDPTLLALSEKVQSLTAQLADFVSANTLSNEQQAKLHEVALRGLAEQQETSMILIKRLDSLEARMESMLINKQELAAIAPAAAQQLESKIASKKALRTAPNDSRLKFAARHISPVTGWGLSTIVSGAGAGVSLLGVVGSASSVMDILLSSSDWAMISSVTVSASIVSAYKFTKAVIQSYAPATKKSRDVVAKNTTQDQPAQGDEQSHDNKYGLGLGSARINNRLSSSVATAKPIMHSTTSAATIAVSMSKPIVTKKSPLGQFSITPTIDAQQLTDRLAEQAKGSSQADMKQRGKLIS